MTLAKGGDRGITGLWREEAGSLPMSRCHRAVPVAPALEPVDLELLSGLTCLNCVTTSSFTSCAHRLCKRVMKLTHWACRNAHDCPPM